jgi:hypothetical protein
MPWEIAKQATTVVVTIAGSLHNVLDKFLKPTIDIQLSLLLGVFPWLSIVEYLTVVLVSLSLAIYCLNRKELPYGST